MNNAIEALPTKGVTPRQWRELRMQNQMNRDGEFSAGDAGDYLDIYGPAAYTAFMAQAKADAGLL